ncbi:hypothetical protein Tco_1259020 [Tanacetum coccineum]
MILKICSSWKPGKGDYIPDVVNLLLQKESSSQIPDRIHYASQSIPTQVQTRYVRKIRRSVSKSLMYSGETWSLSEQSLNVQAFLLSKDELAQENDDEEVFAAGEDMDEDTQADKEAAGQVSLRKVSRVLFTKITKEQWARHEEAVVSYADLRASIEGYYKENVDHREQSDKVIDATMNSLDKNSIARGNGYSQKDKNKAKTDKTEHGIGRA